MLPGGKPVWYFAYGANMSPDIFTKQRKIQPQHRLLAKVPHYTLAFNVPGVPFMEPAVAGLSAVSRNVGEGRLPVHGIAYQITTADLDRIIATEGGGVAYSMLRTEAVVLRTLGEKVKAGAGCALEVYTLVARKPTYYNRRPSSRYLVRRHTYVVMEGLLEIGCDCAKSLAEPSHLCIKE
jgi:hypothetical protein